MLYVGYVVSVEEALRLLELPETTVSCFYNTEPIKNYLKGKNSSLRFHYIDKGACLFGVPVEMEEKDGCFPYGTLEDTFSAILKSKTIFQREVETLKIDIGYVNITWVESEEIRVEHPQPYVITL